MTKAKPKEIRTCLFCGKQFFPRNNSQVYHSIECRKEAERKRSREAKKNVLCLRCGNMFETKYYSSRIYCEKCTEDIKKEKEQKKRMDKEAEKMKKNLRPIRKPIITHQTIGSKVRIIRLEDLEAEKTNKEVPSARIKVNPSMMRKPMLSPTRDHARLKKPDIMFEDPLKYFRVGHNGEMSGKEFTGEDDEMIVSMLSEGDTYTGVAIALGRTPMEVKRRYEILKNSGDISGT